MKEQVRDQIYSLIAEGVEKFPSMDVFANRESKFSEQASSSLLHCQLCSLSQTRKKVLVSPEFQKKKFFILSEFPEEGDENSLSRFLYSEKSSSNLMVKLMEKLGILEQCHFSFAIKCHPEKGIPENSLSLCTQHHLLIELQKVNPEVIFCFGPRSLFALAGLDKSIQPSNLIENSSKFIFRIQNQTKSAFFLSSGRDLQCFPHWRGQVWRFLEQFKLNNH